MTTTADPPPALPRQRNSPGRPPSQPWCANPYADWMLTEGWRLTSTGALLRGLGRRIVDEGTPLARMFWLIRTLHPQVVATGYVWRRDRDEVEEVPTPHGALATPLHLESPCATIFDGAGAIRRRLDGPHPLLDFPVLEDLRAEGATDYVSFPLPFSDGQMNVISVTADRAGGFSSDELRRIEEMLPVLGRLVEVQALRRTAATLLDTYLGARTGERVLKGRIERGDGEDIHAVLWFCDLRDSTAMADFMPRPAFLGLLNEFFDCTATAVLDQGGEVLCFIGDATLAIFPTDANARAARRYGCPVEEACHRALKAALDARSKVEALNRARARKSEPPLRFGLALHVGEVTYGNIGIANRLEFTVIGSAANEAARLQDLCKALDRSILISAAFARCFPGALVSQGRHHLRGVRVDREVFALPNVPGRMFPVDSGP